eukprot:14239150-Alexandrium_andersonii.AAC.1
MAPKKGAASSTLALCKEWMEGVAEDSKAEDATVHVSDSQGSAGDAPVLKKPGMRIRGRESGKSLETCICKFLLWNVDCRVVDCWIVAYWILDCWIADCKTVDCRIVDWRLVG